MRDDVRNATIVMSDGGLPGLVASALVPGTLWLLPSTGTRRRAAAQAQAESLGIPIIEATPRHQPDEDRASFADNLRAAARAALERDTRRVVLPNHAGDDADAMYAVDSAVAEVLQGLIAEDDRAEIEFLTPLLDLTVHQVAELAADLNITPELCWWTPRFENLCDRADPDEERWLWEGALASVQRRNGVSPAALQPLKGP
ncbi:MAG: hypothetical protein JNK58_07050 [Phycisphaerae bacterium]|nr:hypothetical protein [Phycisphaerae bacterium]